MKSKIMQMLELQYDLNIETAGKDWMQRNDVVFENAIIAEAAELLESLGYKWWKDQSIDMNNAKVEVVDLWHFVMSFVIQQSQGRWSLEELSEPFVTAFTTANIPTDGYLLNTVCYQFVGNVCNYNGNISQFANSFAKLVRGVLTFNELYTIYIVKNALNKLRQDRGYTDGTYQKDWNGVEDNAVAMQIGKGLTFDECYAKLAEHYDTHIAL